ncbi:MAG: YfhO family protein [Chloroflexi bacterium]|nr:YfhO family protein [Chloroflexota bacterium]
MPRSHRVVKWLVFFAAVSLVCALPVTYFWPLVTPDTAARWSIRLGDFSEVHFPMHFFVVSSYQHGHIPLWAAAVNAGQPADADIQFDSFYPPTILLAVLLGGQRLLTPRMLVVDELAHIAFAGAGTLIFLLALTRDRASSLPWIARLAGATLAAVAFELSGYLTTYPLQDTDILQVSAWLPWTLLFVDLSLDSSATWILGLLALCFGLAILGGHPQALLYTGYAAALWLVIGSLRTKGPWSVKLASAVRPGLGLALGIALGAVQLLPTLQMVPLTVRHKEPYSFLAGGFRVHELLGTVLNSGFGAAAPASVGASVVLVSLGAVFAWHWRPWPMLIILGAFGLLMSLGGHGPLYPVAYHVFPGFNLVRDQERSILLASFAAACLAGLGMCALWELLASASRASISLFLTSALVLAGLFLAQLMAKVPILRESSQQAALLGVHRLSAFVIVSVLIIGLGMLLGRRGRFVLVALIGIVIMELFTAHRYWGLVPGNLQPYPELTIISLMQHGKNGPFRVSTEGTLPADGNEGLIYGLEDVIGSTPLELSSFAAMNAAQPQGLLDGTRRQMLLNVRYIVTKRTFPAGAPLTLLGSDGPLHLYRLAPVISLPRAWLVHQVAVGSGQDVWRILGRSNVGQMAVVNSSLPLPLGQPGDVTVKVHESSSTHLTAEVSTAGEGLLVWSQIYYPGWHVTVDGQRAQLLRVDGALSGVEIGPGRHIISLTYRPRILLYGGVITFTALVIATVLLVAPLLRVWRSSATVQSGGYGSA